MDTRKNRHKKLVTFNILYPYFQIEILFLTINLDCFQVSFQIILSRNIKIKRIADEQDSSSKAISSKFKRNIHIDFVISSTFILNNYNG